MSDVALAEQLEAAINAMLSSPPAAIVESDEELAGLLTIAAELRELPRADFKARLRDELAVEAGQNGDTSSQSDAESTGIREGSLTLTPYLVVSDVHAEIDFIKRVFDAEGHVYGLGSKGGFHSEFRIGDSMLMIGGGGRGSKWKGTPLPAALHVYVENVDGVYQAALEAGATALYAPTDHEYGERGAAVQDAGGNHWYLATAFGDDYVPAGSQTVMAHLHPINAPKQIDFLKQAFDAEEILVHRSPDGVVHYGKLRLGNSVIEMGEAHDQWQPMPMQFMLYVDDCDKWYERAMKAEGAISAGEPANAPYGGRSGTVKDPFGNIWYLSAQTQTKEEDAPEKGRTPMASAKLFRVALQVADLEAAGKFYSELLDDPGIPIPRGSRHYFNCGAVILALVDVAKGAGQTPQPTPDYIYFAVDNLEEVFERAKKLDCLATDRYHDQNAGEIVKRPWGEVSFYAEDPWGNGLCFVDETTLFTGK